MVNKTAGIVIGCTAAVIVAIGVAAFMIGGIIEQQAGLQSCLDRAVSFIDQVYCHERHG